MQSLFLLKINGEPGITARSRKLHTNGEIGKMSSPRQEDASDIQFQILLRSFLARDGKYIRELLWSRLLLRLIDCKVLYSTYCTGAFGVTCNSIGTSWETILNSRD